MSLVVRILCRSNCDVLWLFIGAFYI